MRNIAPILIFILVFVSTFLIDQTFSNTSFGQQTDTYYNLKTSKSQNAILDVFENFKNDTISPTINITYPAYPPTITTGKIVIRVIASDTDSGIRNVSASAHVFPFRGDWPLQLAVLPSTTSSKNWSQWYIPFTINNTGTYRVVVEATDNAGNPSYAETTINAAIPEKNIPLITAKEKKTTPKIAFIRPTFTEAAYQEHGFYRFYDKYGFPPSDENITTDLDMLTVKTPNSIQEQQEESYQRYLTNLTALLPLNGTNLDDISFGGFPDPQQFWLPFINHIKKDAPNAVVTVMRDEDVNDGHIFYSDNKTNAYDLLLLFHNEYVTQIEYDNLRQFVKNGGNILFIDANVFYAEVRYDKDNKKITLVKGHDFEFNGLSAKSSDDERWYNETKEWVGGNYQRGDIKDNVTFTNNPFNYTHLEEQYVNNPSDKIVIDYGIKFQPSDYISHPQKIGQIVATYILDYGKGKVIMLGLFGHTLADNESFFKFFDNLITHQVFGSNTLQGNK
jgi:hypothetical protein